jgi:uncharacterized ferritin-like protein (DUF455 family)
MNAADCPPAASPLPEEAAEMRGAALAALRLADARAKVAAVRRLAQQAPDADAQRVLAEPPGLPGRPARPLLVLPSAVPQRPVRSREGRVALLHALAHIEFNAINLALDAVWRFAGLPAEYYREWLQVAAEEAAHFSLLSAHLHALGAAYGDLPGHDGLWQMAERTRGDVLARMALVPRTLEARGLDASPAVRNKLAAAGDHAAAAIIDVILRDEIGHVAIGNRWFRWCCAARGLDPITAYPALARQYGAPVLRGPFNLAARRAAGFEEHELSALIAGSDGARGGDAASSSA